MRNGIFALAAIALIACSASTPVSDDDAGADGGPCVPIAEVCNGEDDDCDGDIDEGEDGGPLVRSCPSNPCGGIETCEDGRWGRCSVPPPSEEVCDGADNDCDGAIDEGLPELTHYRDFDGDGFGSPFDEIETCREAPPGYVDNDLDCDDNDPEVHPDAEERLDGIDNNCDGVVDEGPCGCIPGDVQLCGEGGDTGECEWGRQVCEEHPGGGCLTWGPCEGGVRPTDEVCDGLDNDCDGMVDEVCTPDDPVRCWLVAPLDGQLALLEVDMDAGTWLEVGRYGEGFASSFRTAGLAYYRGALVMAGSDGSRSRWLEIDLRTGLARWGRETDLDAAAVYRDQLIAACPEMTDLCFYGSFDELSRSLPSARRIGVTCFTRLGVWGDELYCAWHSTDSVEVYGLTTGDHRTVGLEGYDTWVWGVSLAGGRLHLVDDGRADPEIHDARVVAFDPYTGERLNEVILEGFPGGVRPSGLWCESPGPELP